jgi:hypothetical protein
MKARLLKAIVCVGLGMGSVMGVLIDPEKIAELLSAMSQPKIAITIPEDDDKDDPVRQLLKRSVKLH